MTAVRVFAPAKINLSLHVTGRRSDGYHLLDSLVAFAPAGDTVVIQNGNVLSLTVEGRESAGVPADMDNLALRGAALASPGRGAAVTLVKRLPVSSGIGGGSADAAAAFRGMLSFGDEGDDGTDAVWAMPDAIPDAHARALLRLGTDVPTCFLSRPARVRGIGERVEPVTLPPLPAVLVNPRVAVSTPSVFAALESRQNGSMPEVLPAFLNAASLIGFLARCRNDLEPAAISIAPVIAAVLETLAGAENCRLVRMSGSGATCFGLFDTEEAAQSATAKLKVDHPGWWVAGGVLGDQSARAMPKRA